MAKLRIEWIVVNQGDTMPVGGHPAIRRIVEPSTLYVVKREATSEYIDFIGSNGVSLSLVSGDNFVLSSGVSAVYDPAWGEEYTELFASNENGTELRQIGASPYRSLYEGHHSIPSMIEDQIRSFTNIHVVSTLEDRDLSAQQSSSNKFYLVLDASADPSVSTGSAVYIYDYVGSVFHKVSEIAKLDQSADWDSIIGKPTSSVASIDAAVGYSHTHSNLNALDEIDEDGNEYLLYKNADILVHVAVDNW